MRPRGSSSGSSFVAVRRTPVTAVVNGATVTGVMAPMSPVATAPGIEDADKPETRIAVVRNHASTMTLSRIVKHAELIGADLPDEAFDLLRGGKVHLFAAPREVLMDYAAALPGSRVLEDAYGVNNIGVAIAKGEPGRLAYFSEFFDEAKASGLLRGAIERGGLPTFRIAPRQTTF